MLFKNFKVDTHRMRFISNIFDVINNTEELSDIEKSDILEDIYINLKEELINAK